MKLDRKLIKPFILILRTIQSNCSKRTSLVYHALDMMDHFANNLD